jgi:hypothetical protein
MDIGKMPKVILFVSLALVACGKITKTTEIEPGSPDYPSRNPSVNHFIEFVATVPVGLDVRVEMVYDAAIFAGLSCQKTVGMGVTAPYSLTVPLRLRGEGEFRKGDIAVDAYLPGRCGWHFAGIRYLVPKMWPQSDTLASYQEEVARPDSHPAYQVDVWCMKDRRASDQKLPERCMGWWMLNSGGWVKPDFGRSVSVTNRGLGPPLKITADMKKIEVRFHDVDSMLSSPRSIDR